MENRTWHLSIIVTILCIATSYFTIVELREVSNSLEQRELVG